MLLGEKGREELLCPHFVEGPNPRMPGRLFLLSANQARPVIQEGGFQNFNKAAVYREPSPSCSLHFVFLIVPSPSGFIVLFPSSPDGNAPSTVPTALLVFCK